MDERVDRRAVARPERREPLLGGVGGGVGTERGAHDRGAIAGERVQAGPAHAPGDGRAGDELRLAGGVAEGPGGGVRVVVEVTTLGRPVQDDLLGPGLARARAEAVRRRGRRRAGGEQQGEPDRRESAHRPGA